MSECWTRPRREFPQDTSLWKNNHSYWVFLPDLLGKRLSACSVNTGDGARSVSIDQQASNKNEQYKTAESDILDRVDTDCLRLDLAINLLCRSRVIAA